MPLRITTWNVNGIRNPFGYQPWRENRTFQAMFDTLEADIVVMQETKIQRKDLGDDMVLVPGWDVYFSLPKYKKGYSGVAIYTRSSKCCPIRAEEGITGVLCPPNSSTKFRDLPEQQQIGGYPKPGHLPGAIDDQTLDSEGRCVILEFPAFVLIGVYSPATRDETRTEFREAFIDAMDIRIRNLVAMGKQVVLCGDLNIVRSELDIAGLPERLRKDAMTVDDFFSTPSRRFLNQLVFGGHVIGERDKGREEPVLWDLCREFHPTRAGMYTCWETRKNARPGNFGSRIDYVLCTSAIKDWFIDSNIQEGLLGSDHCPVFATIGDSVSVAGITVHIEDIMNPPGMFKEGKRQREWSPKDLLPTSAKLIPEFDRRQSIRDMFFKRASSFDNTSSSSTQKPSTPDHRAHSPSRDANNEKHRDGSILCASQASSQMASTAKRESTSNCAHESAFSQKPTPAKRQAESLPPLSRHQKKGRLAHDKQGSATSTSSTQSNLRKFFKPKTLMSETDLANKGGNISNRDAPGDTAETKSTDCADEEERPSRSTPEDRILSGEKKGEFKSPDTKNVFDPIQAKESWSRLLGKRAIPTCEHGEDCQLLVTKKPGINCGM
ncbi:hypothetical protein VTI74DRAFT_4322 [Chaetomium olivicolor]